MSKYVKLCQISRKRCNFRPYDLYNFLCRMLQGIHFHKKPMVVLFKKITMTFIWPWRRNPRSNQWYQLMSPFKPYNFYIRHFFRALLFYKLKGVCKLRGPPCIYMEKGNKRYRDVRVIYIYVYIFIHKNALPLTRKRKRISIYIYHYSENNCVCGACMCVCVCVLYLCVFTDTSFSRDTKTFLLCKMWISK